MAAAPDRARPTPTISRVPILLEIEPKAGDTKTQPVRAASRSTRRARSGPGPRSRSPTSSTRSSTTTSRTPSTSRGRACTSRPRACLEYTALLFVPGAQAVRPLRPEAPARRQAVRPARVHHRRLRRRCCRATCASSAAWSTPRTCSSTSAARRCSTARCSPRSARTGQARARRAAQESRRQGRGRRLRRASGSNFGAVLKEGLYEDHEQRERCSSSPASAAPRATGWVSLADYVAPDEGGPGGDLHDQRRAASRRCARSPQLEGCRAKGVEVLLLTDPIDEFWLPTASDVQGQAVPLADPRRGRPVEDRGRGDGRGGGRGAQEAVPAPSSTA